MLLRVIMLPDAVAVTAATTAPAPRSPQGQGVRQYAASGVLPGPLLHGGAGAGAEDRGGTRVCCLTKASTRDHTRRRRKDDVSGQALGESSMVLRRHLWGWAPQVSCRKTRP